MEQIISDAKIAQDFNFLGICVNSLLCSYSRSANCCAEIQGEELNETALGRCARMRETFDFLIRRVGHPARSTTLPEAAKRLFINAVLMAVIDCFPADLHFSVEQQIQGSLGCGPLDYLLKYRDYNIIVTEAKKDDIDGGIAQNVAQLKAVSEVSYL